MINQKITISIFIIIQVQEHSLRTVFPLYPYSNMRSKWQLASYCVEWFDMIGYWILLFGINWHESQQIVQNEPEILPH